MLDAKPKLPTLPDYFGEVRQIAYVVDDLDASMREWRERGITHFLVTRNATPLANAYYRGNKVGKLVFDMAFAYIGDLQLELIQQISHQPTMYTEEKHWRPGMPHHYGVCVTDFQEVYAKAVQTMFAPVLNCGFEGLAQMAYIETHKGTNQMIEVIEWNELTKPYFVEIKRLWRSANSEVLEHNFDLKKLTPILPTLKKLTKLVLKKSCALLHR